LPRGLESAFRRQPGGGTLVQLTALGELLGRAGACRGEPSGLVGEFAGVFGCAVELVCATLAVDLAAPGRLGRGTAAAHACVRELVAPLDDDRPLGADVERVARELVASGRLRERIRDAVRWQESS